MTLSISDKILTLICSVAALSFSSANYVHAQTMKRMSSGDVDTIALHGTATRIAYGKDPLQFGELRLPTGQGPFPVAIVIHGGCYLSTYANVRSTAALSEALANAGIATWNIEYRRYDNPGGGWPGTFNDVSAGADYVRTLAKTQPLDASRVVVTGHSAGGQLALWLPSRATLAKSSPLHVDSPIHLAGVVALGPIVDMREYQTRQLRACGNPAIESVLGGLPDAVPDRLNMVSPILRVPLKVPTVLIAGEFDPHATRASLEAYTGQARSKGDSVKVLIIEGEGHFEAIAPARAAGKAALAAISSLLGVKN